ncbi:hypothetical protein [Bacillus mycoides]
MLLDRHMKEGTLLFSSILEIPIAYFSHYIGMNNKSIRLKKMVRKNRCNDYKKSA